MLPTFAMNDSRNRLWADTVLPSERTHRDASSGKGTDCLDVSRRQFRFAGTFAARLSVLCNHVEDVIKRYADEQVRWVDAMPHVATVADYFPVRYRAEVQLPADAMSGKQFLWSRSILNYSVALGVAKPEPFPAIIAGSHKRPETISERPASGQSGAFPRAILRLALPQDSLSFSFKLPVTSDAFEGDCWS